MSWCKCPACEDGKLKKFWGKNSSELIICPVCKGTKSVGIFVAIDFKQGWMTNDRANIVSFEKKEIMDTTKEELIKALIKKCEGYWQRMLILTDQFECSRDYPNYSTKESQ